MRQSTTINRDSALVLYLFTHDTQIQDLFVNHTRSGSMCINDTIMQYIGKEYKYFDIVFTRFADFQENYS